MDKLCYNISKGNVKGNDNGDDRVDDIADDRVNDKGDGKGGDTSMFAALDIGCAYHYYMFSIRNRQQKVHT